MGLCVCSEKRDLCPVQCLIVYINEYAIYFDSEWPWTDQRSLRSSVLEDYSSSMVYMVSLSNTFSTFLIKFYYLIKAGLPSRQSRQLLGKPPGSLRVIWFVVI